MLVPSMLRQIFVWNSRRNLKDAYTRLFAPVSEVDTLAKP